MSATAVYPTLTIIANALRVADHIAERLGVEAAAQDAVRPAWTAAPGPLAAGVAGHA